MPTVDLHQQTYRQLTLLARAWSVDPGRAVSRLLEEFANEPAPPTQRKPWRPAPQTEDAPAVTDEVPVHLLYQGQRIEGSFDPVSNSITVTTGPKAGERYSSPSAAAVANIAALNPRISPSRNGWITWMVTETGELLQSIRH